MIFTKLPNPIRKTRALKLVFITIPCLKFWDPCAYTLYIISKDQVYNVLMTWVLIHVTTVHKHYCFVHSLRDRRMMQ